MSSNSPASDAAILASPLGSVLSARSAEPGQAGQMDIPLRFTGDYNLAESVALGTRAAFVGAMRSTEGDPPVLDLAFPVEGGWETIGVSIRQTGEGVFAQVVANPDGVSADRIRARLEHMLALDVDGEAFRRLTDEDAVLADLQARYRGIRPVLFASPYEAAARAIIGHRLPVRQAAAVQARIASEYGTSFEIGGRRLASFPTPARLADLSSVSGLAERKTDQLRALGQAAAEGWLDTPRLQALTREEAMKHLQTLAGIGPFSAELILIRGVGDPDAFPLTEMRLHRAMAAAYGLGTEPSDVTLQSVAESWRPYRSWVGLLIRNRSA